MTHAVTLVPCGCNWCNVCVQGADMTCLIRRKGDEYKTENGKAVGGLPTELRPRQEQGARRKLHAQRTSSDTVSLARKPSTAMPCMPGSPPPPSMHLHAGHQVPWQGASPSCSVAQACVNMCAMTSPIFTRPPDSELMCRDRYLRLKMREQLVNLADEYRRQVVPAHILRMPMRAYLQQAWAYMQHMCPHDDEVEMMEAAAMQQQYSGGYMPVAQAAPQVPLQDGALWGTRVCMQATLLPQQAPAQAPQQYTQGRQYMQWQQYLQYQQYLHDQQYMWYQQCMLGQQCWQDCVQGQQYALPLQPAVVPPAVQPAEAVAAVPVQDAGSDLADGWESNPCSAGDTLFGNGGGEHAWADGKMFDDHGNALVNDEWCPENL